MADVVASQVNSQSSSQVANQKKTPVIFEGKAAEYFGIWIVNLLLSIVTLGIYSAWAKVRRKKYFYNNTLIENVGFDYHAKPISILKGRIIAAVLLVVASVNPILQSLVFLIIFIALPWLVVRGSIFNARNTSHRGLRFDFIGTVGKAIRVFIGLPLLTMITLGLAAPYAAHEKNQFLVNNHRFGLSQFDMKRVVKGFYKVYAILIIVPLIGILAAIAIPAYQVFANKAKMATQPNQSQLMLLPNVAAFVSFNHAEPSQQKIVLAANEADAPAPTEQQADVIERVYSDINPPQSSEPGLGVAPEADLQAQEQAPEPAPEEQLQEEQLVDKQTQQMDADEQNIPAQIDQLESAEGQDLSEMQQMMEWLENPKMIIIGLAGFAAYLLFIFGFMGYLQARIGNLIWNNTTLDKLSFSSSLRARDFAWLYFTNIVAIMFTFGLATPWAQIRMARYRASKLHIVGDVDFDQFVGDKKAEVKATGEEIAEMFDVDLSFG